MFPARIGSIEAAQSACRQLRCAGLLDSVPRYLPGSFPFHSAGKSFMADCGGNSVLHTCEAQPVIHIPLFLVANVSVRLLNENRSYGNSHSFDPYWVSNAILVHDDTPLPPGSWKQGLAIHAACLMAQQPGVGSVRGENSPGGDFYSSQAFWYGGWVVIRSDGSGRRHHQLYIPEDQSFHRGYLAR